MALISGWVLWVELAVVVVGVLAYLVVRRAVRRGRTPERAALLAHTAELARLPRYQVLRRRYRLLSGAAAVALAALTVSAALLAARPATVHDVADQQSSRDVMLCLDVSGSMQDLDAAVLARFEQLAADLRGQRIGLMIFDNAALLKFPLTDDTDFIRDQLQVGVTAMRDEQSDQGVDWVAGTIPTATSGSSHIGDGVVSCAGAFDHLDQKRSRSIVLATDGEPGPGGVYSMQQAAQAVVHDDIRVYVLSRVTPAHQDLGYTASDFADLQAIATRSHGALYDASSASAVPQIVAKVQAAQARALHLPPRQLRTDDPTVFTVIALVGVGGLVLLGWRVRR